MTNPMSDVLSHEMSRRRFLTVLGIAGATTVAVNAIGPQFAFATPEDPSKGDVIVHIFLRGGIDGLGVVAPCNNAKYQEYRGSLAFKPSLSLDKGPLNNAALFFHPDMAPLFTGAWNAGKLAIVPACGILTSQSASRSHFVAERNLANGAVTAQSAGLMNRFAQFDADRLNALGFGAAMPLAFEGSGKAFAFTSEPEFAVSGFADSTKATTALNALYPMSAGPIAKTGGETVQVLGLVKNLPPNPGPQNSAVYPTGSLGDQLKQTARMIRGNVGLRSVGLSLGGWDTHAENVVTNGRLTKLASALQAFYTDLGDKMNEVTVVVVSEFGRTVKVNASGGTDHGRGTIMMVMGGKVNGGLYGGYPDISGIPMTGADANAIPVLTDYRTVMAEVLTKRGGLPAGQVNRVLPGFTPPPYLGLVASS